MKTGKFSACSGDNGARRLDCPAAVPGNHAISDGTAFLTEQLESATMSTAMVLISLYYRPALGRLCKSETAVERKLRQKVSAMEQNGGTPLDALRRSQLLYVAMSLAPLGVMTYLAVGFIFPTLQEQGQDLLIYSVAGALVMTAFLSVLGYVATKQDTISRFEQLENSRQRLSDLLAATREIAQLEHQDDIAQATALHLARAVKARAVLVWLQDGEGLRLAGRAGARKDTPPIHLEPGIGLAGRTLQSGKASLNSPRTREDSTSDEQLGIHTLHAMAIPLGLEQGACAVVTVHDRRDLQAFTASDMSVAQAVGQQCAWNLHSALVQEQSRNFKTHGTRLIAGLVQGSLLWSGHIYNVDRHASLVAHALGLDEDFRRVLHFAATLHDIGLVQSLLSHHGRDLSVMRGHPARGAELVSQIMIYEACGEMIQGHHEHMDGTGYPNQLKGDQIHLGARILAISEWWDEATNEASPFHEYTTEQGLEMLGNDRGRRFDPSVTRAFCEVIREHG